MIVRSLLHDGQLRVEAHPRLLPTLARWIPFVPEDTPADPRGAAIRVLPGVAAPSIPGDRRTLHLNGVDAWVRGGTATLAGGAQVWGSVDLDAGVAEIRIAEGAEDADAVSWIAYSAGTLCSALLLGRMGRALAHAAAVGPVDGDAWLLVGDARAGKTTTCANLVASGWRYLSDDHVVLYRDADGRVARPLPGRLRG